jgi:hypothetical protein
VPNTFAELAAHRTIVALVPYVDGQAFIVATANDLFEVDVLRKKVTILTFWTDGKKQNLVAFEKLVSHPIVAMTAIFEGGSTVYVATAEDLFEVNLATKLVTLLGDFSSPLGGST